MKLSDIIDYKEIDLCHLSIKSQAFQDEYKELLKYNGYQYLIFGGYLDQKPWAVDDWNLGLYIEWLQNNCEDCEDFCECDHCEHITGINF